MVSVCNDTNNNINKDPAHGTATTDTVKLAYSLRPILNRASTFGIYRKRSPPI